MTKDEALRKLHALPFGPSCGIEPWLVNALDALGMLKLDEPKSAEEQFRSAVRDIGVHLSELTIKKALDAAGLKIVEK